MKKREFLKEISGLNLEALNSRARELAEELKKLRFRVASGQLEQTHRLREVRRNLARVLGKISMDKASGVQEVA